MPLDRLQKIDVVRRISSYPKFGFMKKPDALDDALWADREFVLLAVQKSGQWLRYASEALRADREVAAAACHKEIVALKYVGEALASDRSFVLPIVRRHEGLHHVHASLLGDREIVLAAARQCKPADPSLLADREFALEIVSRNGDSLQYLPDALRDDREIVEMAIRRGLNVFRHIGPTLRADREIALGSYLGSYDFGEYCRGEVPLSEALRGDREIAISALARSAGSFKFLSAELQADPGVRLLWLVKLGSWKRKQQTAQDPREQIFMDADYKFDWSSVDPALWSDPDFARAACWESYAKTNALVDPALMADRDFFSSVLRGAHGIRAVPEVWRDDAEMALQAARVRVEGLKAFSDAVRGDRALVLQLIAEDKNALQHAAEALRADREVVQAAIAKDPGSLRHASAALRDDRELALAALGHKRAGSLFEYLSERLRADREVAIAGVGAYGFALEHAAEALRADREVVIAAVSERGNSLKFAAPALKADPEVVRMMMTYSSPMGIQYADAAFRDDGEIMRDCVVGQYSSFQYASEALRSDVAYLRSVKAINLDIFTWVDDAVKARALALAGQTPLYRGRRIHFRVLVENSVTDKAHSLREVQVLEGDAVLAQTDALGLIEWETHGPVGSYLSLSAWSSLALIGDFVFYMSRRGIDGTRTHENPDALWGGGTGPDTEDRKDELWLVELPAGGASLDLGRASPEYERAAPTGDMQLLTKGGPLPDAVTICGEKAYDYYKALSEVAKEAPAETFAKFGALTEDGTFESLPTASVSACGGAARVYIDGRGWRWLFPDEGGGYTWAGLSATLDNTGDRDDWEQLRDGYLAEASAAERAVVAAHFAAVDDAALRDEVDAALAG